MLREVKHEKIRQNDVFFAQRVALIFGISFFPREKIDAKNQCHPLNKICVNLTNFVCNGTLFFFVRAILCRFDEIFRNLI